MSKRSRKRNGERKWEQIRERMKLNVVTFFIAKKRVDD